MTAIRRARDDDYEAFARLFPELRVDDPTPSVATWTSAMVGTTLVAEDEGAVVAYAYYQVYSGEGIIRHLVIAPTHQGRRLGQRMMEAVAATLRANHCTRWSLNVKPDNEPAIRLYTRMGMATAYASQSLRFSWSLVERLPAPAPSMRGFEIEPAHDAAVERAMKLAPGQVATARALVERVLLAVTDGEDVVGAAVFVPSFPGAYPFRAASPAAARALLEAIRPHALAEPPYMQVVVEGQPELATALREAGATVRLDILHLEGALP